jgi:hypothetical protein
MPEGVITEVVDGFATIDFLDSSLRGPALNRLLAVGGPGSIQTVTREGPRRKYRVPEGNAKDAGLLDSPGDVVRGDQGYAQALAEATQQVKDEAIRPPTPTSAGNTYSGQTTFDEARATDHVYSTLTPGSGTGELYPPPHGDVINTVAAAAVEHPHAVPAPVVVRPAAVSVDFVGAGSTGLTGPVETASEPEVPEGEPSENWKRDELDAYARSKGLDTADLPNKHAVLEAINGHQNP